MQKRKSNGDAAVVYTKCAVKAHKLQNVKLTLYE